MGFDMQLLVQSGIILLNVVILVFVLSRVLYKPVLAFLYARKERIAKQLTEADNALKNAQKSQEWYDEKLKGVEYERNELLEATKTKALSEENKIIELAKREAELIKQRAIMDIQRDKEQYLAEMKKQIIEISSMIAMRYVEEKIDEKTRQKLLDDAIRDLGDATWLKQ